MATYDLEGKNTASFALDDASMEEYVAAGMATGLIASPTYPEEFVITVAYALDARTAATYTNDTKN